jgi:hypothetical protein
MRAAQSSAAAFDTHSRNGHRKVNGTGFATSKASAGAEEDSAIESGTQESLNASV